MSSPRKFRSNFVALRGPANFVKNFAKLGPKAKRDGTATFLVFFIVFFFLLVFLQFRRVSLGGVASAPWGGGGHMWGRAPTRSPSSPPLPSSGLAGYTGWAVARSVRLGLATGPFSPCIGVAFPFLLVFPFASLLFSIFSIFRALLGLAFGRLLLLSLF